MKESYWGAFVVGLGITTIVLMFYFQTLTNTDEHNYTLLKETTEAAMTDAFDIATYNTTGNIRIDREKFVESFLRRFADSIDNTRNYKIGFYDLNEVPPKVSVKVDSSTVGIVTDLGIKDVYHMGAVMAPAAASTIYNHLIETGRKIDDYDLVLTGDLGIYGKAILKDYMKTEYNIDLKNYDDAASMIFHFDMEPVHAGGSGPACLPLVAYSYIFEEMRQKKYKRVLLVATGALMSQTMVNQKLTIPSIAHAISLEVIE